MSSDPNQPAQPPARRSPEPPDEPAPPTVRMPVQPAGQDSPAGQEAAGQAPPPGRMPPGGMPPGRVPPSDESPAPGRWQEPATAPAPQWQAPPRSPQPPPSPQPSPQWQPTVQEPALDQTVQQPAPGRAPADAMPATQRLQEPWQQQARPQRAPQWQEPQDTPAQQPQAAPQWTPNPQAQAGGQWPPQSPQPPQAGAQWGPPPSQQPRPRRGQRRRRTRRSVMITFTVVVLLILLVIVDRVANAVTENAFASQFQKQGVPVKPSVSIEGFPFLTQLAAKDFNKVDISASNIPVNLPTGGSLSITSVHATINGLHISGYSSSANAKVDHITATAFVSFGSLAAAGSLGGAGVTLTQAGPNTVKITAGVAGLDDTEEAQILQTGPQTITIKIIDSGGGLGSVLGSIGFNSFTFSLPKVVPASLRITGITLNSQGLTVSAAASNATFSQSSSS